MPQAPNKTQIQKRGRPLKAKPAVPDFTESVPPI